MKKTIIYICLALFVILAGAQYTFYTHEQEMADSVMENEPSAVEVLDITITAVGDCTFATDTNAAGKYSFNSEYERQENDPEYFLKKVRQHFEDDDLTIVNFEGTLSENGRREDKEFAFRGKPEYVNILTSSSVEAANLANNHTLDYGEISFSDTKEILSDNGIIWCEGKDFGFKEIKGIKIGLIGTGNQHRVSKKEFIKRMEALKSENPDLIIANFHWGVEKATKPNKSQKDYAKLAIDNGADLVIGHHPHILQGIEKYRGKYILYSLGNFCFGGSRHPKETDTMIFKQTFTFENGILTDKENVRVIPCSISSDDERNNYQPIPLTGEDFVRVKEKIEERSSDFEGIKNIEFIKG
jgi:poly-gamma-glutamate synthesis protein (capsule biosynthesis protein)